MKKLLLLLLIVGCCIPEKKELPVIPSVEFKVFKQFEAFPSNYSVIGEIFVGSGGIDKFQPCNDHDLLKIAIEETKTLGGNALKITEIKRPTVNYECYRLYGIALIKNDIIVLPK